GTALDRSLPDGVPAASSGRRCWLGTTKGSATLAKRSRHCACECPGWSPMKAQLLSLRQLQFQPGATLEAEGARLGIPKDRLAEISSLTGVPPGEPIQGPVLDKRFAFPEHFDAKKGTASSKDLDTARGSRGFLGLGGTGAGGMIRHALTF